jgi:diguanylate cyclase (GGDEF)-like protein
LLRGLLALFLLGFATLAQAQEVQLRGELAVTEQRDGEWTWLTLRDPRALHEMPAGWQLLVDQVRFADIAVVATAADGSVERQTFSADRLQENWAPGGLLKFEIAAPGSAVRTLSLGFHRIDDLSLMRKVTAAAPHRAATLEARWLVLMGLFTGLLVSAFAYNLVVHAGKRSAFQRWYLGWVAVTLAYGLVWSNLAAYVFPGLAGPRAVRIDSVLVGLSIALGSLFLTSVLEAGKVPAPLRRAIQAIALACAASGLLAADERLVPAALSDRVLNVAMLACVGTSVIAMAIAAARRSRVVWLYLLGWTPVIAVFAARAARNFGLEAQSDLVDLATFAAIGFESLVFSLVIADRFLILKRERDDAEASARGMAIEKETLRRAAHSDFLTGLGNRASFHAALRDLYARGEGFTLFLLDVDYLKELNDRQGHDAGDALLRHIGARLAEAAGPGTSCARIGGDEFAILCGTGSDECERIGAALDRLQGSPWLHRNLSLSIGVADTESAASPAELFEQADIALYEAKKLGRGRRQAFDSRLRQQIQSRLDLIRDAQRALARDEFALHFQPIVDLRASKLIGVEALLRWHHPERGLITPERFASVLADEQIGPLVQQRVLELAIAKLQRHPSFTGTLAVNFTAMDLHGADAAHAMLRQLAAAGIAPSALCVEVTEGTLLGKADQSAAALHLLHAAGVKIALDDFGTGYASLVHLKEIPVDTLKIDRSFVAGLLDVNEQGGHESEEIVRAVLALGHGLKKTVIAEGVETVAQLDRLRELGCEFAQGYLFGRPSAAFDPAAAFRAAA